MKQAAMQFTADMQANTSPYWLSLVGTSGAGKTMLARMIRGWFLRKLEGTIYFSSRREELRLRGRFIEWTRIAHNLRASDFRMFDDLCNLWFLVVDDIGAEHGSEFINAKLYELASRREKRWTVFTSNLSLEGISAIDARIASRMIRHGSIVVDVQVPDFNDR